jgi:prephenate dehydratase
LSYVDTAGAAAFVAERGDPALAAIAPAIAAELYGLQIIARNVEDSADNMTRFVILARDPLPAAALAGQELVTTFSFDVKNSPAPLYKALGGFATNGVNLTKLESYMVEGEFSATMFLADVDGHPDDPALARALDELRFFSRELRILGVYPAHAFRQTMRAEPLETPSGV